MDKQKIEEFLKKNDLGVLATANKKGKTQAAVMAYVFKDNLLFVFTETTTRKYKNIVENNQVSLIVGGFKDDPTVQIDGTIAELGLDEGGKIKESVLNLHPEWKGYFDSPNGRWFAIKPSWMRYSDFSANPPEVLEINV